MRWKRWVSCCRCCGNIKERSEILNQRKSVRTPEGFLDAYAAENSSGTRGVGRTVAELN